MKKLFFTLIMLIAGVATFAAVRTAVTGNWHLTAANNTAWGAVTATSTADTCIIPNGVTVTIQSTNVTCGALIVETGGTLTFQSSSSRSVVVASGGGYNGTVTINGTVAMANSNGQFIQWNGPSFTVAAGSNWTWGGTSSSTDGGIHFAGTGTTTIFGNGKTIGSLQIDAGGTVNISGDINFRGQGTSSVALKLQNAASVLNIPTGNTVTLSANNVTCVDINITSGGKINVNGTAVLDNKAGTLGTIAGAGAITFNGTSKYIHNHAGLVLIGSGGTTVVYNTGTTCEVRGAVAAGTFSGLTSQTFQNFIWNTSQAGNVNFNGVDVTVNGNFEVQNTGNVAARALRFTGNTAGSDVNIGGNFIISGLNGITTVDMVNGTGSSIVTVNGNVSIGGNSFSSTLTSIGSGGSTLRVKGNWTNGTNGVFTSANTTVEFNSTTANQTITKSTTETFNTLVINNTFGGTGVTASNGVSASTLTLTAGKLVANTTVSTAAGLSTGGSTNYVVGSLTRTIASGAATVNFPIGDASNYTPVSIVNAGGSTAVGTLQASTTAPGAPASGNPPSGSGLSTSKYVNRSWTLTPTITGTPNYTATFTFVAGDLVGSPNTSALLISKNNGGTYSLPGTASSSATNAVTTAGQSSFSTFQVGEQGNTAPSITSNGGGATANINVAENTTAVTTVTATDAEGLAATPYSITGGADAVKFSIVGATGVLTFASAPDYETPTDIGTNNTYEVEVTVTDAGGLTDVQTITVTVTDVVEVAEGSADFRSKSPGGNLSSASTWEYFNGSTWVNATQKPGSGNNVDILHSVTFDENFTIGAGKTLTVGASGTADFNNQVVTVQSNSTGTGAIGKVTTGGSITNATQVQVERFIPSSRQAWRLLGVPTTGSQTIRQAWMELEPTDAANTNTGSAYGTLISAGSSIYVGNGSQNPGGFDVVTASASIKWYNYTSGTAAFYYKNNVNLPIADTFTNGYFLFVRGNRGVSVNSAPATSAATLRSKGGINVGTVVKSLHYPGKYRLLANPYASTIDFKDVDLVNVTNGFYLWDASIGTTGGYSYFDDVDNDNTYNLISGFGQYDANNSKIQSGQAFLVIAPSAAGTVTFTEDDKVSGSSNAGLRPAPSTTARLQAVLSSGKTVYDGTAVLFADKFSNEIDINDAVKLYNPGENLGVVRNGKSFVVESRGAVATEEEVQYEVKNLKQQDYTIEFRATNMTGEAWLVDNYLGTRTALNMSIGTKVNFSVTAEAKSAAADRFKVVFRPAAVTTAPTMPSIKVSPNPVEGGIMNVSFSQQGKGRYNLKLVDLSGRLLLNTVREHAGGSANQQLTLPSNLANGTYQLVITAPDRSSSVRKVLVNNK